MLSAEELLKQAQALNEDRKYAEVIQLLGDDVLKTHKNADLYYEKGRAYDSRKEYNNAIESFTQTLNLNPNYYFAYNGIGNSYSQLTNHEKAIEYYDHAIKINPSFVHAYNGLGNAYNGLRNHEKAIEYYNQAIEINPNFYFPYLGLGNAYIDLKNNEKAIECYNQAIKIDPTFFNPYNGLGNAYSNLDNYEKAIEYYNKAITIGSNFPHPYNGLGVVYCALKNYEKAIECFNNAIEIDPTYQDPYFGRAFVYQNTEKYEKALFDYNKYIELTLNSPNYFTALAKERIGELEKLVKSQDYSKISETVNQIKDLLLAKDQLVTHYTGLSITKILVLGEKALFRLSEGAFLNDTSEGRELFNFLPSLLPISNKSDGTKAKPFTTKPFIGSFVSQTQHDDLTLWRMYGKEDKEEAKGCAITIDSQELLESLKNALTMNDKGETIQKLDEEFSFYRVAYRKSDKEKFVIPNAPEKEDTLNILMTDLYKRIEEFVVKNNQPAEIQNVVELLNRIAYLFKSFEYQYENEIRLVVNGIGFLKNINVDFIPPKVFINLVAIRPFIRRITLGPKVEKAEEWASAFYYSLDKEDLHPEILISHLPFK